MKKLPVSKSTTKTVKAVKSLKTGKPVLDLKAITTIGISVMASQLLSSSLSVTPNKIYEKIYPSIYTVSAIDLRNDPFSPKDMLETVKGTGTGFAYFSTDYVITNAHVVNDAFSVKIDDIDAEVVGVDAKHDIAVLKMHQQSTHLLKRCEKPAIIGEPVLAVGNPFGFVKSVTTGIISGKERTLDSDVHVPLVGLLQTDAAINPGNSGGPLLNANTGCVLGVNTALVSSSGVNSGLGFAIPIDAVDEIVNEIINQKAHEVIQLGVSLLPDTFSDGLGIQGAIIANVVPGGIASDLSLVGIHRDESSRPIIGDIIVQINGKIIKKNSDIYAVLEKLSVGDELDITVLRKDGLQIFHVNTYGS